MSMTGFLTSCNGEIAATATKMASPDYIDRMEAEYAQARIRMVKLLDMLEKWECGELDFEPNCPRQLLEAQFGVLSAYVAILEEREKYEDR